eukprot:CFRG5399T1
MNIENRHALIRVNGALEAALSGHKSVDELRDLLYPALPLLIGTPTPQIKKAEERARLNANNESLKNVASSLSSLFGATPGLDYTMVVKDTIVAMSDQYNISEALLLEHALESMCENNSVEGVGTGSGTCANMSVGELDQAAVASNTVNMASRHLCNYIMGLYLAKKKIKLSLLQRLLQLSAKVVVGTPAEVTVLVQDVVEQIVCVNGWVERLVDMASYCHNSGVRESERGSGTGESKMVCDWEECAVLVAHCLLFLSTRDAYAAQQARQDEGTRGDGASWNGGIRPGTPTASNKAYGGGIYLQSGFSYVFANQGSLALVALIKLMKMIDPNQSVAVPTTYGGPSLGTNLSKFAQSAFTRSDANPSTIGVQMSPKSVVEYPSDFSIVILHAVYYSINSYCAVQYRADNPGQLLIDNRKNGDAWKNTFLESCYLLFMATAMEREIDSGDTDLYDALLKEALGGLATTTYAPTGYSFEHSGLAQPSSLSLMGKNGVISGGERDVDAGRENVLRMLRTRVVSSWFVEKSENRELFLQCYDEILMTVYGMRRDVWLAKSQTVQEMLILREFIDLLGVVYKDWPEGTTALLTSQDYIERLLSYNFDIPREDKDYRLKARHCLAVYASFLGMLGSLCNSSVSSTQLIALIRYREDRVSWTRFKEFIDFFVHELDPSRVDENVGGSGGKFGGTQISTQQTYYDVHTRGHAQRLQGQSPYQYATQKPHSYPHNYPYASHLNENSYNPANEFDQRGPIRRLDGQEKAKTTRCADLEINPTDVKGLRLILRLIRRAAQFPLSQATVDMTSDWPAVAQLFRLMTCRVPITLRATVLRAFAAFAMDVDTAYQLWSVLDERQILSVISNDRMEIEVKDGIFPLTLAFLELLLLLFKTTDHIKLTNTLGLPRRTPGLEAYLTFVVDVFVKTKELVFAYESERWKLYKLCLQIFEVIINQYQYSPTQFRDRCFSPVDLYDNGPSNSLQDDRDQDICGYTNDLERSIYPDGEYAGDGNAVLPGLENQITARPPGMDLFAVFLSAGKKPLLKVLLGIVEKGVDQLTKLLHMARRNGQCKKLHTRAEACIKVSLRLIRTMLDRQAGFIELALRAGSSTSLPTLVPLEKNLISADKHPVTGHTNCVKAIARFISYNETIEIAYLSVCILGLLSKSPISGPKLVSLVRDAHRESESSFVGSTAYIDNDRYEFMMGYVQRIVQRSARILDTQPYQYAAHNIAVHQPHVSGLQSNGNGIGTTSRRSTDNHGNSYLASSTAQLQVTEDMIMQSKIIEEIVQVLLINLTEVPFPNLAHYILGYDLQHPLKTDLKRQRTCLHYILAMLQEGVGARTTPSAKHNSMHNGTHMWGEANGESTGGSANAGAGEGEGEGDDEGEWLFNINPKQSELCYKLIYLLCTQAKTSVQTLDWLRNSGDDYFCSQLRHVRLSGMHHITQMRVGARGRGIDRFTLATCAKQWMDEGGEDAYGVGDGVCSMCRSAFDGANSVSGISTTFCVKDELQRGVICLNCYGHICARADHNYQTLDDQISLLYQHTWFIGTFTQELLYNIRHHPQSRQVVRLVNYLFSLSGVGETQGRNIHMITQGGRIVLEMLELLSQIPVEYSKDQSLLSRFFLYAMGVDNVFDHQHLIVSENGTVIVNVASVLEEAMSKSVADKGTDTAVRMQQWGSYLRLLLVNNYKSELSSARQKALEAWQQMLEVALQGYGLDQSENVFGTLFEILSGLLVKMEDYTLAEACARSTVAVSDKLRDLQLMGNHQAPSESRTYTHGVGWVPTYQMQEAMDNIVHVLVDKVSSQSIRSYLYTTLLNLMSFSEGASDVVSASNPGLEEFASHSSRGEGLRPSDSLTSRLIPTVATDAMSGNGSCKAMGVALMGRLLKSESSSWIANISQHDFLDHFIGLLKNDDVEVSRVLHTKTGSLIPIYNYEAKMSFLVLVASVSEGASALVASGILRQLGTFKCLQESPLHTDETDQSFGSIADRHRRVVLWALRLVGGILASVGRQNVFAVSQALDLVEEKKDMFMSVLSGGAHSSPTARLTPHVLEEIKLTVGIFYRLTADSVEFGRRLGENALRIHKHLLTLLFRFAVPSRWRSKMSYPISSTHEKSISQSNACGVSKDQSVDPLVVAMAEADVRDICMSLVSYLRSVVRYRANGKEVKQIIPLLSPSLTNAMIGNDVLMAYHPTDSALSHVTDALAYEESASGVRPPSLSALVIYIRTSIPQLLSRVTAYSALGGRMGVGASGSAGVNASMGTISGNMHFYNQSAQGGSGVYEPVTMMLGSKELRIANSINIRHTSTHTDDSHAAQILLCGIESALYLLMLHLQYYLTEADVSLPSPYASDSTGVGVGESVGADDDGMGMIMSGESTWDEMTSESREKLKSAASSCLAQVLDNLKFSADLRGQLFKMTGSTTEFVETVGQEIRTLLELERRKVSY